MLWVSILLLLCPLAAVGAYEFLEEPVSRANYTISSPMLRGNGIVPWGDHRIVATTNEGELHILSLNQMVSNLTSKSQVYRPDIVGDGRDIVCHSSAALVENNNSSFAIYTVIDLDSKNAQITSRVLAVDLSTAFLRWTVTIPGKVMGNPILSSSKDRIYVIHNVYNPTTTEDVGQVSVISIDFQQNDASVISTLPLQLPEEPYGPGTLRSVKSQEVGAGGKEDGPGRDEKSESVEILFFGERGQDGFSSRGKLYAMMEGTGGEIGTYKIIIISNFPGSGITPPVVSSLLDVYLGTQASYLIGFSNGRDFGALLDSEVNFIEQDNTDVVVWENADSFPKWVIPMQTSDSEGDAPIPATPVLSTDEQYIFVAAAGNEVGCIMTGSEDGSAGFEWSYTTKGTHYATPIYQEFEGSSSVVYFVEQASGTIRQFDATDGTLNWETSVGVGVEADFMLSPNGGILYYGDVNGNIGAFRVATVETSAPTTSAPSTTSSPTIASVALKPNSSPARSPVSKPVNKPVAAPTLRGNASSEDENQEPSSNIFNTTEDSETVTSEVSLASKISSALKEDLPMYLGIACGGMIMLILMVFCCIRRSKKKSKKKIDTTVDEKTCEQEEADRQYELQKAQCEEECTQNEVETLEAIVSPVNRTQQDRNSQSFEPVEPKNITQNKETESKLYSPTVAGFEINYDDHSVTESLHEDVPSAKSLVPAELPLEIPTVQNTNTTSHSDVSVLAEPENPMVTVSASSSSSVSLKQQNCGTGSDYIAQRGSMEHASLSGREAPSTSASLSGQSESSAVSISNIMQTMTASLSKQPRLYSKPAVPSYAASPKAPLLANAKSPARAASPMSLRSPQSFDTMEGYSNFMEDDTSRLEVESVNSGQRLVRLDFRNAPSALVPLPGIDSPIPDDTLSLDDSLYTDENFINEMGIGSVIGVQNSFEEPMTEGRKGESFEESEDEPPAILKPGAHYFERHSKMPDNNPSQLNPSSGAIRQLDPDKIKPMYKGVSVRPSRSKAGIFSRRMPALRPNSDGDSSVVIPDLDEPQRPLHSAGALSLKREVINETPRVQPTPPSYYVEEQKQASEKPKLEGKESVWSDFLHELSMAENQFFNPIETAKPNRVSQKPSRKGPKVNTKSKSRNEPDSDSEQEDNPPPPPRSFYA